MPCGGCGRTVARNVVRQSREENSLNGGYANLTARQINARLEIYKRRYCSGCSKKPECDYESYLVCKGK